MHFLKCVISLMLSRAWLFHKWTQPCFKLIYSHSACAHLCTLIKKGTATEVLMPFTIVHFHFAS